MRLQPFGTKALRGIVPPASRTAETGRWVAGVRAAEPRGSSRDKVAHGVHLRRFGAAVLRRKGFVTGLPLYDATSAARGGGCATRACDERISQV